MQGKAKLLGYTAFEDVSGSGYHRPAEHTHTSTSRNLTGLQQQATGGGDAGGGGGARTRGGAAELPPVQLLEDDNDDLCHVCGLGVSGAVDAGSGQGVRQACTAQAGHAGWWRAAALCCLLSPAAARCTACSVSTCNSTCCLAAQGDLLCCESCPAVFHAACLGLAAPPEGDFHCPACRCTSCGAGGAGAPAGVWQVAAALA